MENQEWKFDIIIIQDLVNPEAKEKESKSYALFLGDTVVVGGGGADADDDAAPKGAVLLKPTSSTSISRTPS